MKRSTGRHLEPKPTGSGELSVAQSLLILANVHRDSGKARLSEALYQQALRLMERAVGQDHPAMADVFENYAALLRKTHRQSQAEEMGHRAAAIRAGHGGIVAAVSGK
jgi:Tfp pilus assembly protein PilF